MAHFCLINPPGIKTTTGLQMHTPNPPLGLAYIAAAVREAGHRVTVIDATGEALDCIRPLRAHPGILVQGLTPDEVVQRLPADVDAVGLGCVFSTLWPLAREILDAIHAARPDLPIVVGGEHVSALPENTLEDPAITVCVLGEGEETIVELLPVLLAGGDLSGVAGIAYRRDGEPVRTLPRQRRRNIDDIPLPAWDLVPVEGYVDRGQMNGMNQGRAMPILATRGCPFRCTFCSSPQMWTTLYRTREPARVCDEIELYMRRYGATDFHFQDLTAIVNRKWILALCEEILRRGLKITWQLPSGTRCEAIDDEVCRMLKAAGFKQMSLAPESGSEQIRQAVQKRVNIDHMMSAIQAALRQDLTLGVFFVIGFPPETRQTLRETLRLIRRLGRMGVPDIAIAKFVPYPGSAIFRQLVESGRIRLDDEFFLSPLHAYSHEHVGFAEAVSTTQLQRWMVWMYLNFYALYFLHRPLRTIATVARALLTGREETRYAKWFRDIFGTRRRWRRAARSSIAPERASHRAPQRQDPKQEWQAQAQRGHVSPQADSLMALPVLSTDAQEACTA